MRKVLCLITLFALSSVSVAADQITTTDGHHYRKAKDGRYYPSAYVNADGTVSTAPVQQPATGGCANGMCMPAPQYRFAVPQQQCPSGNCPAPKRW